MRTATDIEKALTAMRGGQRKTTRINGHRVYVACTMVGEKHVLVDGCRVCLCDPAFTQKVTSLLKPKEST